MVLIATGYVKRIKEKSSLPITPMIKRSVIYGRVGGLFLCSNDEFPKVHAGPPSVGPIIR